MGLLIGGVSGGVSHLGMHVEILSPQPANALIVTRHQEYLSDLTCASHEVKSYLTSIPISAVQGSEIGAK